MGYEGYQEALRRTDPATMPTVRKGSAEEKAAMERFADFVLDITEDNVRAKTRKVYAADAYLNDTLKELHGIGAVEQHFLMSARSCELCTARILDVTESNGNYYFRWVMDIKLRKYKKGQLLRSIGMSHIRFDGDGRVVFHQDYWDSASAFYAHLPVIGRLIGYVKGRL